MIELAEKEASVQYPEDVARGVKVKDVFKLRPSNTNTADR
jgi:hypothetical protein